MAGAAQDLIDELDEAAGSDETTRIEDLMDAFGSRGSGAFLVIPALIGISPIGAIPTVPTLIAVCTLILAVQIAMGRDRYWLPGFIECREVSTDKIHRITDKLRGPAHWLDRHFGERLTALTGEAGVRVSGSICAALCLLVPPLEVVPFGAAIPFAAIAITGVALTVHDGIAILIAWLASAASVAAAVWFLI
ncbi:exopolysaccharide biosynthesis protein [Wenxinia saemankumensis]|uniref:Uncharacterized conserved protein n=1 Tax=Wenxinia saemankumensis TaxID=1447782 RepID=A0A1M6ARG2_9RHOB|nr:exopolysaccharide biosynthesis protein [Wenxinia saemankumensis]SHI39066.1 Uncharacterized conserved protein [Wenxinia saemankumensis]